ncbi:UDP-N-acetylmuramoyl-L-alanine--D-glutamate ligase [Kitasatospora sp. NPDC093550]|uniref:UDP-N-acetylmuramoyl-L-alanine--D-glutamate ligase n=1 Tax=Kitasatospora sp. NPDC093550 TaxID=3364089 RepID=UPI0038183B2B
MNIKPIKPKLYRGEPVDLKGKPVLVIGLGMSGQSAAELGVHQGAKVTVMDAKSAEELPEVMQRFAGMNITYKLRATSVDPTAFQLIVRSPAIDNNHPVLIAAREAKIHIWSEIELAFRLCPAPVIAVSGTNGKGSVTTLITRGLKAHGKTVHLVGNIGTEFASKIPSIKPEDIVVLEVSAAQLQNSPGLAPATGVLTNINPEHSNLYDWDEYVRLKGQLLKNNTVDSLTVVSLDDEASSDLAAKTPGRLLYTSMSGALPAGLDGVFLDDGQVVVRLAGQEQTLFPKERVKALGALPNTLPAIAVLLSWGVPLDTVATAITGFEGREHVTEYVGTHQGVDYYNDAKATNVDSTAHALNAIDGRTVVLISGGEDNKGVIFARLVPGLHDKVHHLITFGPTADQLVTFARSAGTPNIDTVADYREAIALAQRVATPGQTVLFSPGTYSPHLTDVDGQGRPVDYIGRGVYFKESVRALTAQQEG